MNWIPGEVKVLQAIRSKRWLGHIVVNDIDFMQNTNLRSSQEIADKIRTARVLGYLTDNGNGVYSISAKGLAELAKYDNALFDSHEIETYMRAYQDFVRSNVKFPQKENENES